MGYNDNYECMTLTDYENYSKEVDDVIAGKKNIADVNKKYPLIFLEPASKDSTLLTFDNPHQYSIQVKVTGQFYVKPDYPKGTIALDKNTKMFRYTEIKVISQ